MTAITRSHVARYVQDLEDTWAFRLKIAAEHERDELRVRYGQQRARVRTTLLAAVLGMTDLRQLLHDPDGVVIAATDDGSLIWDTLVDVDPEPRFYVGPRPGFLRYHTALADVATLVPIDEVRRHLRERITERIAAITSEERALTAAPGDPDWERASKGPGDGSGSVCWSTGGRTSTSRADGCVSSGRSWRTNVAADGRAPQHSVRPAHGPDFTETIMSDPTDPAATTDLQSGSL